MPQGGGSRKRIRKSALFQSVYRDLAPEAAEQILPGPMGGLEYAGRALGSAAGAFVQEAIVELPLGILNLATPAAERLYQKIFKERSPDMQVQWDVRSAMFGDDYMQKMEEFEQDGAAGSVRRIADGFGSMLGFVWGIPGKVAGKLGRVALGGAAARAGERAIGRSLERATLSANARGVLAAETRTGATALTPTESAALTRANNAIKAGDPVNAWRNLVSANAKIDGKEITHSFLIGERLAHTARKFGIPTLQTAQGFAAEAFLEGGAPGTTGGRDYSMEGRLGSAFSAAMIAPLFTFAGYAGGRIGVAARDKFGWSPRAAAMAAGAAEGLGFSMFEWTLFEDGVKAAYEGDYRGLVRWLEHAASSVLGFAFMKGVRPRHLMVDRLNRPEDYGPDKAWFESTKRVRLDADLAESLWSLGFTVKGEVKTEVERPGRKEAPKVEPAKVTGDIANLVGPRGSREQFLISREGENLVLVRGKKGKGQRIVGTEKVREYLEDFASKTRQSTVRGYTLTHMGFEPAGIFTGVFVSPNAKWNVRFDTEGRLWEQSTDIRDPQVKWQEVSHQGEAKRWQKMAIDRYGVDPKETVIKTDRQERGGGEEHKAMARERRKAYGEARDVWWQIREMLIKEGHLERGSQELKELDQLIGPFWLPENHNGAVAAEMLGALTSPEFLQTAQRAMKGEARALKNLIQAIGSVGAGIYTAETAAMILRGNLIWSEKVFEALAAETKRIEEAKAKLEKGEKPKEKKDAEAQERPGKEDRGPERGKEEDAGKKERGPVEVQKGEKGTVEKLKERVERPVKKEEVPLSDEEVAKNIWEHLMAMEQPRQVGNVEVASAEMPQGSKIHFADPVTKKTAEILQGMVKTFSGKASSEIEAFGRELVKDWAGERDLRRFRLRKDTNEINRRFPKPVQEDMTFYMERTGNPYKEGDTFEKLSARLSPEAKEFVDTTMKGRLDDLFAFLVKHGYMGEEQYRENYITHLWTGGDVIKRAGDLFDAFQKELGFDQPRRIPTYSVGIKKLGLTPRVTAISDILNYYESKVLSVIANEALIAELKIKRAPEGTPLIVPLKERTDLHVTMTHPSLRAYAVHKDLIRPLEKIFDWTVGERDFTSKLTRFNMYAKAIRLFGSFFHFEALIESAFQSGGVRGAARAVQSLIPGRLSKAAKDYREKMLAEHGEDAILHGLSISAPGDVGKHIIDQALEGIWMRGRAPGTGPIRKTIGTLAGGTLKVKLGWDRLLWENLHATSKLHAWHRTVAKNIKKFEKQLESGEMTVKQIKREAAMFVNDAFGGQNWNYFFRGFRTKRDRGRWQLALLAPDWTLSNLRVFGRGAAGFAGGLGTAKTTQGDARAYMIRSAILGAVVLNGLQYLYGSLFFTDEEKAALKKEGKTLSIFDNDPNVKLGGYPILGLRLGKNEAGEWEYATPLKQVTEIFRWMIDPVEIGGAKLSPLVQHVVKNLTDESPGSGFPAPWEGQDFWDSIPERAKGAFKDSLPISMSGSNQWMMTLPKRRGMTKFGATKLLTKQMYGYAYSDQDSATFIDNMNHILDSAKANNVDTQGAFRTALYGMRGVAFGELIKATNSMDEHAIEEATRVLDRLGVTPAGAKTSLQRRFVRLIKKGEANFTEREWRSKVLPPILRKIRTKAGFPIRKYQRTVEVESRRKARQQTRDRLSRTP